MTINLLERPGVASTQSDGAWFVEEAIVASPNEAACRKVAGFRHLGDGWAGPGSVAPSTETIATATEFAERLAVTCDAVSPLDDGEIMFEWDLEGDFSVYAHAKDSKIIVVILDGEQNVEKALAPGHAAEVVSGLVGDRV